MFDSPLTTLFSFVGTFYGLVIPLLTLTLLTLLVFAGMSAPGAKPKAVGEAIVCYLLHATGVLLMIVGAMPTVYTVFAAKSFDPRMYGALLLVFAVGGLLFLVQDQAVRSIDAASRAVIESIYMATMKIIGNVVTIVSSLSLLLNIVLGTFQPGWWVTSFTYLLFGLFLSWCTRDEADLAFFKSISMQKPTVAARMKSLGKTKRR